MRPGDPCEFLWDGEWLAAAFVRRSRLKGMVIVESDGEEFQVKENEVREA